jgi:hypothetical protein
MISIGAYFGEPGQQDSPIGLVLRAAMDATARCRGDWIEGSTPGVNVVFYVHGSIAKYDCPTKIEAARFSRKQKLLLVAVPVPKVIIETDEPLTFVIDALHQANAIAAEVFAKKSPEQFDFEKAEAIVERVQESLAKKTA